ncbi:MAG: chitobiase/beta-hexosaminidase C-terminal domain-containing protein [Lachnospiraceae bacterium]|nr:chitobiase/beta-hexosaminidase C-terminal domain-containing protein [Lachnospiraceae bacterium]
MKKCSNCGAQLPDNELFCPRCGEEVQLVPIFETVESSIKEQQRILEEKEREKQAIMAMEEEEREKAAKKRNTILISVGVVALIVVAFLSLSFILKTSRKSAFNGKYTKAVEAYNAGDYDQSLELITVALEKDPGNMEGKILMADIYAAQGKTDMSAALYLEVIDENPDSETAYKKLIGMYEILGQGSNIHALLSRCTSESILTKFADYICQPPVLSVPAGTYDSAQKLEITDAAGNTIHYTLDGSEPSKMSLTYSDAIGLTGGKITVRAISVNAKGVPSDVIEAIYEINADFVDSPIIFPRGNTFTFTDGKDHRFTVIVPRGTRALYSFDAAPTSQSAAYTGPVDMLEGTHVFYAVLVDKKTGMMSTPASISYTLSSSEVQESISIVQDADGNYNASYSDGTEYVPPAPDYNYTPSVPDYTPPTPEYNPPAPPSGGGGTSGGGNTTPDPGPAPGGDGGGEVTPDPGPGGDGGGEVTPDPGPGGDGGGEVTPDPGPAPGGDGGGEVAPDPGPGDSGEPVAEAVEE